MIEVSNSKTLNKAAIQRTITDRLGLPWDDRETEEARARFLMKALRRKKFVVRTGTKYLFIFAIGLTMFKGSVTV